LTVKKGMMVKAVFLDGNSGMVYCRWESWVIVSYCSLLEKEVQLLSSGDTAGV
jgi:hypothetical protein